MQCDHREERSLKLAGSLGEEAAWHAAEGRDVAREERQLRAGEGGDHAAREDQSHRERLACRAYLEGGKAVKLSEALRDANERTRDKEDDGR